MDKTSGDKTSRTPRNAQIDSEKARLRDKPPRNSSLPQRYVSAASPFFSSPFTRTLRSGVCLSPFFTTRETTLRPRPASTVTASATSAAPTKRRAIAPRAEEISGALSPAAQRQRRTRARQRPALSRRPRGRAGVFYRRFMEKAKAASAASAPPAVRRRPAAALRCGALRHGGAASAIWSGQAESG